MHIIMHRLVFIVIVYFYRIITWYFYITPKPISVWSTIWIRSCLSPLTCTSMWLKPLEPITSWNQIISGNLFYTLQSHKNYLYFFRYFRVIPASEFIKEFASDRRHMRRPDGTWIKPPPNYPVIANASMYWFININIDVMHLISRFRP